MEIMSATNPAHLLSTPGLRIPDKSSGIHEETGPVDSPLSPSSPDALARFEFEAGRGNEGTKIIMVEWSASAVAAADMNNSSSRDWDVSWEGKTAAFTLHESDAADGDTQRIYCLIPPAATVPASVTITQRRTGRSLTTKCMPAIFAPGLGVSKQDAGKRGVLHSQWAKKRLADLQKEIDAELRENSESVGLEMAFQERQWIVDHFGLVDPHATPSPDTTRAPRTPTSQSPRSPGGGRLADKLRGLKLATSSSDLSPGNSSPSSQAHSGPAGTSSAPRVGPPAAGTGNLASLDAVLGGGAPGPTAQDGKEPEDELFALPMSPRSPEMKTSPFSFLR